MPKKEKQKNLSKKKKKNNVSSLKALRKRTQQKQNNWTQELPFWIPWSHWSQVLANDSNIKGRTPSSK